MSFRYFPQVYEVCKRINCSRKADAEKVAHTVLKKVSHPPPNNYAAQFNGQKEKIISLACFRKARLLKCTRFFVFFVGPSL